MRRHTFRCPPAVLPAPTDVRGRARRGPGPWAGRGTTLTSILLTALLGLPAFRPAAVEPAPRTRSSGKDAASRKELPAELLTAEARAVGGMVSSGVDDASRAGARILAMGGNAVDAAVATAFAIGVVDPLNAGLGGECYILIHLRDGTDIAIDGSAPVPIQTSREALQGLLDSEQRYGYKTAATPATGAALAYALQRYGTMTLPQVLAPACELAEFGHTLLPTIQTLLDSYGPQLREDPFLSTLFFEGGVSRFPMAHLYCQPVLARTLQTIAMSGMHDFYRGAIADTIAADMESNGGYVSKLDLARIQPRELTPVRGRYRGFEVIAFPYPGGGDVVVRELRILDQFPADLLRCDSTDRLHLLLEAGRIAIIDAVTGEPAPVTRPTELDREDEGRRAALIRFDRALRDDEITRSPLRPLPAEETTHVSVVDRFGNAVAMTQSIGYGAYVASPNLGFQYNSLLEDGDFCNPQSPLYVAPGRSLPTMMAPTILLRKGRPFLVLGGAGSSRIPATIVSVITNVVDRGLPLADAVADPRVMFNPTSLKPTTAMRRILHPDVPYYYRFCLELADPITASQADELEARGFDDQYRLTFPHRLADLREFGAVNAVMVDSATRVCIGAGDPRRQGAAAGPNP
jgi:gamma-glutamyltranspeptidase/glutathione hydrolase